MIIGCNLVGVLNFIRSLSSVEEEQPGEAKHYPDHLVCREVLPVENQANKYKKDRNGCVGKKRCCTYVPARAVHFDETELNAKNTYTKQYACPVKGFHVQQDALVLNGKKIKKMLEAVATRYVTINDMNIFASRGVDFEQMW